MPSSSSYNSTDKRSLHEEKGAPTRHEASRQPDVRGPEDSVDRRGKAARARATS